MCETFKELVVLMEEAEVIWIKEVQRQLLEDRNFKQWRAQLQLFVHGAGIWRCGGRLTNVDISYQANHPILLPGASYFTLLVIRRAHERVFHNGVKETLNEICERFWVLRGRATVRKLVHKCVLCHRLEGQAYATPQMPPLPVFGFLRSHHSPMWVLILQHQSMSRIVSMKLEGRCGCAFILV